MTEETTNTTVETTEKELFTYYYSDPQSSNYQEHCIPIHTTSKLEVLPWRWHAEVPDASLVDPVWDNQTNGWIENAPKTQAQLVAKLQHDAIVVNQRIDNLVQKQETLSQDSQRIDSLQKMQMSSNAMLGQLSNQFVQFGSAIQAVTQAVNNLTAKGNATPAENIPKEETSTNASSDDSESNEAAKDKKEDKE